jgi:hypothetical protein
MLFISVEQEGESELLEELYFYCSGPGKPYEVYVYAYIQCPFVSFPCPLRKVRNKPVTLTCVANMLFQGETNPKSKQSTQTTRQAASSELGKREIDRYERSDAQETGSGLGRRVYLLGENRWEEPDRLKNKQEDDRRRINGTTTTTMKASVMMCFQCRGVGTMLCTGKRHYSVTCWFVFCAISS